MAFSALLSMTGIAAGLAGLAIQAVVTLSFLLENGRDIPGALGTLLSFYTILTNMALVAIHISHIAPDTPLGVFRSPVVRGLMVANMTLVLLFVHFVIGGNAQLAGMALVSDRLLHYVTPSLYALWWIACVPHGRLALRDLPLMLLPTLLYFAYVMARGAWVREYPYDILDLGALGHRQVIANSLTMIVALAILCLCVIGLDRLLPRLLRKVDS